MKYSTFRVRKMQSLSLNQLNILIIHHVTVVHNQELPALTVKMSRLILQISVTMKGNIFVTLNLYSKTSKKHASHLLKLNIYVSKMIFIHLHIDIQC